MKYIDFTNIDGRMCNHFYLAFQAYQTSKKIGECVKYIRDESFHKYNLDRCFDIFNLNQFSIDKQFVTENDTVLQNTNHWCLRYHQCLFVDYNIENIEKFIEETFLSSNIYKNIIIPSDDTIAIHIRNCDYLSQSNKQFDLFDKVEYINRCFNKIDNGITKLIVFSDDIEYTKQNYGDIFKKRFHSVDYSYGLDTIEDFVSLSLYKNKILWNSTFSYWSAFIGNVIHKDSYENVFAPSKFEVGEPICNHVNPLWRIINV